MENQYRFIVSWLFSQQLVSFVPTNTPIPSISLTDLFGAQLDRGYYMDPFNLTWLSLIRSGALEKALTASENKLQLLVNILTRLSYSFLQDGNGAQPVLDPLPVALITAIDNINSSLLTHSLAFFHNDNKYDPCLLSYVVYSLLAGWIFLQKSHRGCFT